MAMSDEILSRVSMARLADQLGTDEETAREAAEAALPALFAGITGDAANPDRREALLNAAQRDHDPRVLDADDPLALVDTTDGNKIVDHVLRGQRGEVEDQLHGFLGQGSGGLISKLLPMLAPLVMSWLAGRMSGGSGGRPSETQSGGGGGLGDLLGGMLGGGAGASSGGGLGDLLGGLLGGGSGGASGAGGGLDDLMNQLGGGQTGRDDRRTESGDVLGDVLGQLGGKAGGGGLDDLLGSIMGGQRRR